MSKSKVLKQLDGKITKYMVIDWCNHPISQYFMEECKRKNSQLIVQMSRFFDAGNTSIESLALTQATLQGNRQVFEQLLSSDKLLEFLGDFVGKEYREGQEVVEEEKEILPKTREEKIKEMWAQPRRERNWLEED